MRKYRFVQVDVFTNRPFGGNQLAVFPEAEGIADTEMQAIAREMNFSETTFVLPPTDPDHDARVRIFTPGQELPMAGHPTVGTGFVLGAERGEADVYVAEVLEVVRRTMGRPVRGSGRST